jgi:hypothetical protein
MEITPNLQPTERAAPARPGEMAWTINPALRSQYAALYAPVDDERFPIPAVKLSDINPEYLRKAVFYPTQEQPGTIIINPQNHFLYRPRWRAGAPLWRRRRAPRIRLVGRGDNPQQAGVAGLVSAQRDDSAPARVEAADE